MQINLCPKCGREPAVMRLERNCVLIGYEVGCVECYNSGLHSSRCKTYADAVTKWNEITKGTNK